MPHTINLNNTCQVAPQPRSTSETVLNRSPRPKNNQAQLQQDELTPDPLKMNWVCKLCDGPISTEERFASDRLHHTPGLHRIAQCLHCGHQKTTSSWTPQDVERAYPPYYLARAMCRTPSSWRQRLFNYFILRNEKARAQFVCEHVKLNDRHSVLDIGCGNGGFLSTIHSLTNACCHGLEMDAEAARMANSRDGITATCGTLEKDLPHNENMDLVTLWHVLEHLTDPVEALRSIKKSVRPGGYVAIGVPDCAGWTARVFNDYWFGCDAPRHRSHFTKSSLQLALRKSGWHSVEIKHITEVSTIAGSLHNVCRRRWCDDLPAHLIRWSLLQGICLPFDHLLRHVGQGDWLIALAQRP